MKVQLQFNAMAHFHVSVEMDEETFKKFKALKEDELISEHSDPELWNFIKDYTDQNSFDHLIDEDFEDADVEEYIDYPFNNETYEHLLERKGESAVEKKKKRMAKLNKLRATEV